MAKGYWIVRVDVVDQERGQPGAQCSDRVPQLPGSHRLLALAGVPTGHEAAATRLDRRSRHHRGLRWPAAVLTFGVDTGVVPARAVASLGI